MLDQHLGQLRAGASVDPTFTSEAEALAWCRTRYATFGIRTEERWQHLVRTSFEADEGGRLRLRFDQRAVTGQPPPAIVSLWEQYLAVQCPVFVGGPGPNDVQFNGNLTHDESLVFNETRLTVAVQDASTVSVTINGRQQPRGGHGPQTYEVPSSP